MKTQALRVFAFVLFSILSSTGQSFAQAPAELPNIMDELNPFDPNIEKQLEKYDAEQERETGMPSHIGNDREASSLGCFRAGCTVFIEISRAEQKAYVYVTGELRDVWKVSTGGPGATTPNFDRHPNGRIYDRYSSRSYPGGDYKGLGNMPYVVFIEGGFAIHGTPESNWDKLGTAVSHGCVRVHPDHGYIFNRMVRLHGIQNVWISIHE